MSIIKIFIVIMLLYSSVISQTVSLHGVNLSDMDRSVEACNNFYDYANGTWRNENPIPASMPRWSRRWQAGEKAKDRLREILDGMLAKTDYPKGSVDQLVSDFYRTCNDEALADANGIKPIEALLVRIDKAKSRADLQPIIAELASMGITAPFGIYGG